MASVETEDVFKKNYGSNFVWIIDNFRFQTRDTLLSRKVPYKSSQKAVWDIEFKISGKDNLRIEGSVYLNKAGGKTGILDPYKDELFLSIFLAQLNDEDEIYRIFIQKEILSNYKVDFSGDFARGKSYPYDSLRLCFCYSDGSPTPGPNLGLITPTTVKINLSKNIVVSKTNLFRESETGSVSVFDSYTDSLLCGTVSIESKDNNLRCKINMKRSCILYCKVSVINEKRQKIYEIEEWFFCGASPLNYFTQFLPYEDFEDIIDDMIVLVEVAVSTKQEEFQFLEEPRSLSLQKLLECTSNDLLRVKRNVENESLDHSLINEIWMIYGEKKLSDFSIKVGKRTFPVHKMILSARSPVFEAMLESEMAEKKLGTVEIIDFTPETVEKFLTFIYSDKMPDEFNHIEFIRLYSIAEKYQVKMLKKKCSSALKSGLTVKNVCDVLELVDLHQDENLKDSTLDFIKSNADALLESKEWKKFMRSKLQLAADAMHFCLLKKK